MLPLGIRTPPAKTYQADSPTLRARQLTAGMLIAPTSFRAHNRVQHNALRNELSLTTQHYGLRRRTGFPPKYLQRSGDTHMRSKSVAMTGRIGVAQLAIYCSPASTTPLAILSGRHIQTRAAQVGRRPGVLRQRSRGSREPRQHSPPLARLGNEVYGNHSVNLRSKKITP